MKYASSLVLAGLSVGLVGCASGPKVVVDAPLGPAPTGVSQDMGGGSLVIYSARAPANVDVNVATWRWNNDFGRNEFLYEPAHSDYTIYTTDGQLFKHVRNARDLNDGAPTVVALPTSSYIVEAEGINCDSSRVMVRMAVVIKSGQTTMAYLDGDWNPVAESPGTELAKLPCGRAIGWRADEAGLASAQARVGAPLVAGQTRLNPRL